jgi:hypothetical protein
VKYPCAAKYLIEHYNDLESRVFKKKNIREFNRRWYEYIWPRDPRIMLGCPRILSPRLVRKVRFVLDGQGYLSDDGCVMLQPTDKTSRAWQDFAEQMKTTTGESLSKKQLLQYCLAFMNSNYAQERLVTGHRPTPKGSYAITESYLNEIPIPAPQDKKTVKAIIGLVGSLERQDFGKKDAKHEIEKLENRLGELVEDALTAVRG